jgi:hypothetical protein
MQQNPLFFNDVHLCLARVYSTNHSMGQRSKRRPDIDPASLLALLERVRRALSEEDAQLITELMPPRQRARMKAWAFARHIVLSEFFGDQRGPGTSICRQPIRKKVLVGEAMDLFEPAVSERWIYEAERRHRRAVEASLFFPVDPAAFALSDLCSGKA